METMADDLASTAQAIDNIGSKGECDESPQNTGHLNAIADDCAKLMENTDLSTCAQVGETLPIPLSLLEEPSSESTIQDEAQRESNLPSGMDVAQPTSAARLSAKEDCIANITSYRDSDRVSIGKNVDNEVEASPRTSQGGPSAASSELDVSISSRGDSTNASPVSRLSGATLSRVSSMTPRVVPSPDRRGVNQGHIAQLPSQNVKDVDMTLLSPRKSARQSLEASVIRAPIAHHEGSARRSVHSANGFSPRSITIQLSDQETMETKAGECVEFAASEEGAVSLTVSESPGKNDTNGQFIPFDVSLETQSYSCEKPDPNSSSSLRDSFVRQSRYSLHGRSGIPTEADLLHNPTMFHTFNQGHLDQIPSRNSVDNVSTRHSTGITSLNTSIGEISTRQSTANTTPRNNHSSAVGVIGDTNVVPNNMNNHESTMEVYDNLNNESCLERYPQVQGESVSQVQNVTIERSMGYIVSGLVEDRIVDETPFYYLGHGNSPGISVPSTVNGISHPVSAHVDNCANNAQQTAECVMVDEEEEDGIFLIRDEFHFPPSVKDHDSSSMSMAELENESPMYTARGGITCDDDERLYTGREGLDFSFSYSDAAFMHSKEGDEPEGNQAEHSPEDNVSRISYVGTIETTGGDNIALESNNVLRHPSTPVPMRSVDRGYRGSFGPADGSNTTSNRQITFSERVCRFVESLRTGQSPKSPKIAEKQDTGPSTIGRESPFLSDHSTAIHGSYTPNNQIAHETFGDQIEVEQEGTTNKASVNCDDSGQNATDTRDVTGASSPLSQFQYDLYSTGIADPLHSLGRPIFSRTNSSSSFDVSRSPFFRTFTEDESKTAMGDKETHAEKETLHVKKLFNSVVRDKIERDGMGSPYSEFLAMFKSNSDIPSSKRIKLSKGKTATPEEEKTNPATPVDVVTCDASRLVRAIFRSIKVLIGKKILEKEYETTNATQSNYRVDLLDGSTSKVNFDVLSKSFTQASTPQWQVYQDTKALATEMLLKLREINQMKDKMNKELMNVSKGIGEINQHKLLSYCFLARSVNRLQDSIKENEDLLSMQKQLILAKTERIKMLKAKVADLSRRQKVYDDMFPKMQQLDKTISVISNAYAATGIQIVPLTTGNSKIRWCIVLSFNSDTNRGLCTSVYDGTWHDSLVRASKRILEEVLCLPVDYRRLKDNIYDHEINMVVYLLNDSEQIGNGIITACTRSMSWFCEDSPEADATSTPRGRSHVPFYRSNEIRSNEKSSVVSPFGYNHAVCNMNGTQIETLTGIHIQDMGVSCSSELEGKVNESPVPAAPINVTISDINWEETIDLKDIKKCLKVVITCPRSKTCGGISKVLEQAMSHLIQASNRLICRFISQFQPEKLPLSVISVVKNVGNYGSLLSSRIRILQRELYQLLKLTSGAELAASDERMRFTAILRPKDDNKPFLQLFMSAIPEELIEKASYISASTDVKVSALLPADEPLADSINNTLATLERVATVYDTVALACERNNHKIYN